MADNTKADAETRFARAQKRAVDANKAQSEAEAESRRVDANTARLRALRLAKEAADAEAAAKAPPKPPAKPKARKKAAAKSIPVSKLNASNDD